uniref:sialin isoform X4 n=1 Tax=Ciona intestinalis TaxID=7719 RepID=UPI000EF4DA92|nr:sialin isoform X4 [Ciona intestinalis]XP_026692468.1 sialin isoform X4 [Ciona intestinalis]XP_026692469.1 sialin isoform X4 [Ciona intestinalis]|eukprot:XP_026692467.1 sialin isoform X4 [Ciona intestinalis]
MMNIDEPLKSSENVPRKKFYVRQRYVLASLGCMGYFLISCLRNCINVTVLSMVRWNNTETNVTDAINLTIEKSKGFEWSSSQEGLFLGAYFYGYVCTNILGGWLGNKFGFPIVFGLPIFISALLSIATPFAAYTSFPLVIACRVLMGLLQGASVCAFQGCWSSWAPPLERSLLNSIALSGFPFGLGFANFFAGYICGTLGWEAVFYILGGVAIGWSVVWIIIVSDSPRTNRCITAAEVAYIEKSIGFTSKVNLQDMLQSQVVPWGAIMRSRSVWAIFVAHFCDNWSGYTFNAILPTFMSKIFNFNVFQSGAVMTAPYIAQVVVSILAGFMTDAARQRKWISTSAARKVNTIIAQSFLNLFMIIACYCTDSTTVIVLFVVGMSLRGFTYAGHNSSPIDIAPMYAGVVFGISNTIASITGFLGPLTAGLVITDKTSIGQWQTMFWINGALGFFGSIFFACFASEVERKWAQIKGIETLNVFSYCSSTPPSRYPVLVYLDL